MGSSAEGGRILLIYSKAQVELGIYGQQQSMAAYIYMYVLASSVLTVRPHLNCKGGCRNNVRYTAIYPWDTHPVLLITRCSVSLTM